VGSGFKSRGVHESPAVALASNSGVFALSSAIAASGAKQAWRSHPLQNPSRQTNQARDVGPFGHDGSVSETNLINASASPLRKFVDRHLALLGAVLLVVIATFRVYFVVSFDMQTALAVLAIVDRTQLLTTSVLTALVFVLPILFVQPDIRRWVMAGNDPGATFPTQLRTALLWIPLGAIVLGAFTLPMLLAWFIGWLLLVTVRARARRSAARRGTEPPSKNAPLFQSSLNNWILATLIGLIFVSVLNQPWLAREAVHMEDDEQVVASVVGIQGEMTLLLVPQEGARWVKTEEIDSRAVCQDRPEWHGMTLFSLIPREGFECGPILDEQRRAESD
jgi:hypothetical protein